MSVVSKSFAGISGPIAAVALGLVALAIASTNPLALGPIGVTAWFALLGLGLISAFSLVAYLVGLKLQPKQSTRGATLAALRRGSFVGGYITVILAFSSLQQLNLRNSLLLLLLLVLTEFYLVARA